MLSLQSLLTTIAHKESLHFQQAHELVACREKSPPEDKAEGAILPTSIIAKRYVFSSCWEELNQSILSTHP